MVRAIRLGKGGPEGTWLGVGAGGQRRASLSVLLAAGALLLFAALPAAEAGQGGNSDGCTKTVSKSGSPRHPPYIEIQDFYCDNPSGSTDTDCTLLGPEWSLVAWETGKRPDYNGDGLVCHAQYVFRY